MTSYILNLIDLAFTLYALNNGIREMNPLMQSVPIMVIYKVVIVGGFCWILHHFAKGGNMAARRGIKICTAGYAALAAWHIVNFAAIVAA